MSRFRIVQPATREEWDMYYRLRFEVLRKPWKQPESSTQDETEKISVHLLAIDQNARAAGTARLQLNPDGIGQIRSMAVRHDVRGHGLGTLLLTHLEKIAESKNIKHIILDARENAIGFYQKHGYKLGPASYLLFGIIRHFHMYKHMEENNSGNQDL